MSAEFQEHLRNISAGEAVLLPQGQHAVDAGGDAAPPPHGI